MSEKGDDVDDFTDDSLVCHVSTHANTNANPSPMITDLTK
jgi:hypothetical protein